MEKGAQPDFADRPPVRLFFLRSEELAYAMEARGYDPKAKRSRYRKSKWRWADTFCLLLGLAFAAAFIYVCAVQLDFFALFGVAAL